MVRNGYHAGLAVSPPRGELRSPTSSLQGEVKKQDSMNDTPKQSWWQRLSGGLKRTSSQLGTAIKGLVSKRKLDASTLEELENELIRADFGMEVADRTIEALREGR